MRRILARGGKPFCQADIRIDDLIFERAPDRFKQEIAVLVLRDLGVNIVKGRQNVTVAYADFGLAKALGIKVNSAVFKVFREFFDEDGLLICSAKLLYPCDLLELETEFSTGSLSKTARGAAGDAA